MRAHDFLTERSIKVEIPINITIPQDGSDPKVSVADNTPERDTEAEKVMVSPLQQEIEMAKAEQGKESPVIDELTDDDEEAGQEKNEDIYDNVFDNVYYQQDQEELENLKALLPR